MSSDAPATEREINAAANRLDVEGPRAVMIGKAIGMNCTP
jgi:hypothetical protein